MCKSDYCIPTPGDKRWDERIWFLNRVGTLTLWDNNGMKIYETVQIWVNKMTNDNNQFKVNCRNQSADARGQTSKLTLHISIKPWMQNSAVLDILKSTFSLWGLQNASIASYLMMLHQLPELITIRSENNIVPQTLYSHFSVTLHNKWFQLNQVCSSQKLQ